VEGENSKAIRVIKNKTGNIKKTIDLSSGVKPEVSLTK